MLSKLSSSRRNRISIGLDTTDSANFITSSSYVAENNRVWQLRGKDLELKKKINLELSANEQC